MPLPNKAGEPEFKIKIEPADKLVFKYKGNMEETSIIAKLTNTTKDRVCFKVKCTDNEIFRVRPPLGFLKPGEKVEVKIIFKPKNGIDPTRHFFAIYHLAHADIKANPRHVWLHDTKPDGVIRMQAVITDLGDLALAENENKDKKEKEKKEEKKEEKEKEKEKDDEKKEDRKEADKKEEEKE